MPDLAAGLTRMGLTLPAVPVPLAAYVPAVAHGGLVYTSGQLPLRDGQLVATGLVGEGGEVDPQTAAACARQCALNALAAAAEVAGGAARIAGILRVVGYVASAGGFTAQPAVVNGASELIGELFGEAGRHARSAVGVARLPMNAPVEVELVALLA